jgi:hypothetical protein
VWFFISFITVLICNSDSCHKSLVALIKAFSLISTMLSLYNVFVHDRTLREPTQKFPTSPASRLGGERALKKIPRIFSHMSWSTRLEQRRRPDCSCHWLIPWVFWALKQLGSRLHIGDKFYFFLQLHLHASCTKSRSGFLKKWVTTSCEGALRESTQKFPTSPASWRGRERAHKKIPRIFSYASWSTRSEQRLQPDCLCCWLIPWVS